jgi:hypothetical protein
MKRADLLLHLYRINWEDSKNRLGLEDHRKQKTGRSLPGIGFITQRLSSGVGFGKENKNGDGSVV